MVRGFLLNTDSPFVLKQSGATCTSTCLLYYYYYYCSIFLLSYPFEMQQSNQNRSTYALIYSPHSRVHWFLCMSLIRSNDHRWWMSPHMCRLGWWGMLLVDSPLIVIMMQSHQTTMNLVYWDGWSGPLHARRRKTLWRPNVLVESSLGG